MSTVTFEPNNNIVQIKEFEHPKDNSGIRTTKYGKTVLHFVRRRYVFVYDMYNFSYVKKQCYILPYGKARVGIKIDEEKITVIYKTDEIYSVGRIISYNVNDTIFGSHNTIYITPNILKIPDCIFAKEYKEDYIRRVNMDHAKHGKEFTFALVRKTERYQNSFVWSCVKGVQGHGAYFSNEYVFGYPRSELKIDYFDIGNNASNVIKAIDANMLKMYLPCTTPNVVLIPQEKQKTVFVAVNIDCSMERKEHDGWKLMECELDILDMQTKADQLRELIELAHFANSINSKIEEEKKESENIRERMISLQASLSTATFDSINNIAIQIKSLADELSKKNLLIESYKKVLEAKTNRAKSIDQDFNIIHINAYYQNLDAINEEVERLEEKFENQVMHPVNFKSFIKAERNYNHAGQILYEHNSEQKRCPNGTKLLETNPDYILEVQQDFNNSLESINKTKHLTQHAPFRRLESCFHNYHYGC